MADSEPLCTFSGGVEGAVSLLRARDVVVLVRRIVLIRKIKRILNLISSCMSEARSSRVVGFLGYSTGVGA